MIHKRLFVLFLSYTFSAFIAAYAQDIHLGFSGSDSWYFSERSNWSTYVNGQYKGLTHREIRSRLEPGPLSAHGRNYSGHFYKTVALNRDALRIALPIDVSYVSNFVMKWNGALIFATDEGYPEYRDFPVFPNEAVTVGSVWTANGIRVVDPKNDGRLTDLPILVEYRLQGEGSLNGEETWRIDAKFATRYPGSLKSARADTGLKSAFGTHDCQIIVRKSDGAVLVIMDRLDETFAYGNGESIRYKGNTAIFAKQAVSADIVAGMLLPDSGRREQEGNGESEKSEKSPTSAKDKEDTQIKPWVVEKTEQGVRISIRDLLFEADSDMLLPTEKARLDSVYRSLSKIPDGHFLVEGHTASTGKQEGEKRLSIERAKKVIDELCERGMRPEQFMYRGFGGTVPIGDNATAEGRAKNRRVEITVLD